MIYCTECGTPNPEGTQACLKCNTTLPVLDNVPSVPSRSVGPAPPVSNTVPASTTPVPISVAPVGPYLGSTSASWWQRLGPDWKAALIFWIGYLVLSTVNTITGGLGSIFSVPFNIAIALGQGVFVAQLASKDSRYTKADYLKLGLLSGLWNILIDLVGFVVIVVVMVGATLGTTLAVLPVIIIFLLGVFALRITLTGLGSWLYRQYGGKKLVGALAGTGCGCMVIVGVLLAIVIRVLPTLWR